MALYVGNDQPGQLRAIEEAIEALAGGGGGGPVTIADGDDAALGATDDSPSLVGGGGTVSAKLRLITTQLGAATPAGTNNIGDVDIASIAAGETHIGQVGGHTRLVNVTLSLDTSAYASGDVLADTQIVNSALRISDGTGILQSLVLVDQDDQGMALDIYFLDANVSMGTENAAPSISDANALAILGCVSIATGDYKDLGGAKVAIKTGIGMAIKAVTGTDDIYVAVVNSTGTPTYSGSGMILRVGVLAD